MDSKYKRHVPKNRRNAEILERKEGALLRLKRLRERSEKIKKVEKDVFFQTGDEYFFKIYSTYTKNGKLYRKTKIDSKALKKDLLYINFEIKRSEKRLQKHLCEPEGVHIRFEDFTEKVHQQVAKDDLIDHRKTELERSTWTEYIKKLQTCKAEIHKRLIKAKCEP